MNSTLSVGTATFTNTNGALVVNGVEVFRLRPPGRDNQLRADFEVRSTDNHVLAIVRESSCVEAAAGVAVRRGPAFCEILDRGGKVLARAEKLTAEMVGVCGTFHVDGGCIRAGDDGLFVNGSLIEGRDLDCSGGPAVSIGRSPDRTGWTFEDETVVLDGMFFRGCTFRNCLLIYTGRDLPLLVCCYFDDDCRLELREHAQRTAQFMAALHRHLECGGKGIVEKAIDGIRQAALC